MEKHDRSNFSVINVTFSVATVNEILAVCSNKKFQLYLHKACSSWTMLIPLSLSMTGLLKSVTYTYLHGSELMAASQRMSYCLLQDPEAPANIFK